jgi:hypothetical protein
MRASLGAKSSEFVRSLPRTWRVLGTEQRVAAVGSLLLIVSTFGPFTFVEAAQILTALGVLLLLKRRADGYQFHLPFGDGTAIAAAGAWSGLLILIRLFDRSLGQNLLALACAAIVFAAGFRERSKRPMDDVPADTARRPRPADAQTEWLDTDAEHTQRIPRDHERTQRIPRDAERTERLNGPPDRGSPPAPPRQ